MARAATEEGLPGDRYGSHSLRIGGGVALYLQCKDVEIVRRFGRWQSSAFHGYLWEGREQNRGVAAAMARGGMTLMAAHGTGPGEDRNFTAGA